jgi:signal transduction histidine kinase
MLKILILEDNPDDAGLALRVLKKSETDFDYRMAENKADYISALNEFQPDVILSDHSLPGITSEEALPIAKEICPQSVFILVTGTVSEEFAVKILKSGADDYILKSSLMRLPSAIMNAYMKKTTEKENEQHLIKLVEVNKELKTFIYRASHDLRAPLSSMRGLINVAKIEQDTVQMSKLINLMDHSAEKLDKIVIDLVETLGIRDRTLKKETLKLEEIAKELLVPYSSLERNGIIRFKIDCNCLSPVASDKAILEMVLKRIIDNAVKFHNYSVPGAHVIIKLVTSSEGAEISISDNGIGIKEELQGNVFDMFYRANNDTEGSGLGLYLAKIGVEKLGGRIMLKSIERLGTTIQINLPPTALSGT